MRMRALTLLTTLTASLLSAQASAQSVPADLQARYDELVQATLAGDIATVRGMYLPDAQIFSVTGQLTPLNVALEGLNPNLMKFSSLKYELRDVKLSGDQATVQAWQTVKGEITPIGGIKQAFEGDALSEDIWQKVNGKWMIAATRTLEQETRIAGQVIRQVAPAALSEAETAARRDALLRLAAPLSSVAAAAQDNDFAWLGELVRGARVLGAGEGSHGTAEHFQLKDRVFRELVTKHGFTVLAIEDSFASGEAVDRYVRGQGPDDADAATRNLQIMVWQTQEVRDLLKWMRQYNASRGDKPELRVVGIDMQVPHTSVEVLGRLLAANPQPAVQAALKPLLDIPIPEWFQLTAARAQQVSGQVLALQAAIHALPAQAPNRAELLQLAETVRQGVTFWQGVNVDFNRANLIRDAAMSANTRSAFDTLFPGQRGMLWAHNFHVSKVPAKGQTYANLGQHLARAWGDTYRTLGFSFAGGELLALESDPAKHPEGMKVMQTAPAPAGSLDTLISTDAPAMYLKISQAAQDPALRRWFSQPIGMAAVGATYTPGAANQAEVNLPAAFDGVIFVKRSSATKPLPMK